MTITNINIYIKFSMPSSSISYILLNYALIIRTIGQFIHFINNKLTIIFQQMKTGKEEEGKTSQLKKGSAIDIIRETRKLVSGLTQQERFEIAKQYLNDALRYKTPRLDTICKQSSPLFKFCYKLQTSELWKAILIVLSYIIMYSIVLQNHKPIEQGISFTILGVLWIDTAMEIYHKRFEILRITSRFQARFYIKIVVLILLVVDQFMFSFTGPEIARPLVLLRCTLPIIYDRTTRKSFQALRNSYKDTFVYVAFYTIVILTFAIIAHQVIQIPQGTQYDRFTDNYTDLGKIFFIIYVLSSYQSYPDNQLVAIRQSMWIYFFFIVFILLNLLFFNTIPTTVLFNSYRETRSKIILIDQIKQQHSLIMSFVSLGEQNLNISQEKFISFLLYVYKKKVRYVDYLTQVCLKVDKNSNGQIHVNQYMQLCKILQSKSSMMPPRFDDWEAWVKFRRFLKNRFKLKKIVKSKGFSIVVSVFIIVTFVNCCLALYQGSIVFYIIDDIIMGVYFVEIILKILGLGPENFFFRDIWNKLDFFLVLICAALQIAPANSVPHNSDILIKMTRIFRVNLLVEVFDKTKRLANRSDVYMRSKKLLSQIFIIIPIVLKFLPFYLISSYALGVLGMQIFRKDTSSTSGDYGDYNQFSNFTYFLGSQFIFVQILVEAGWETIAYDHADRYGFFILTMLFFVLSHILMVIVLSSLMKGLAWEVYNTVEIQFQERKNEILREELKQLNLLKKKSEFSRVKQKIKEHQLLIPDNLITRGIYQNKINQEIWKKIKNMFEKMQSSITSTRHKKKRRSFISNLMEDHHIFLQEIQLNSDPQERQNFPHNIVMMSKLLDHIKLDQIQDMEEQDIEEAMEKVLSKVLLHPNIKFTEAIVYPQSFVEFLQKRMRNAQKNDNDEAFDLSSDGLHNQESLDFHTYELQVLLGIQNSQREQKTVIVKSMVNSNIISSQHSVKILTKHQKEKDRSIEANWVMRKMFLSDTNQSLINKFEIEYFSNIYGKSFRQINKVTIEPLLQLESKVTYCLKNALRYRNIDSTHFFIIISQIEDIFSNQLLKKGSLFKFVYQIDSISDTWFAVELKESNEVKINFIKTGLWAYNKSMAPNEIQVGKDIFNWDFYERHDQKNCQKYIKLFFQGFQTLAFSLQNSEQFFKVDPRGQIYDLYTFFRDVHETRRFSIKNLSISKIMPIVLSLQEEREHQVLPYNLSDLLLSTPEKSSQDSLLFKLDESQNQTFKKLKKIQLMDHEKIIETQGLPFAYIVNFLQEVSQILHHHEENLVYQIQKVLNKEFEAIV